MADGKSKRKYQASIHAKEKVEDSTFDPVNLLDEITKKYTILNEKDLDIVGIYKQRRLQNNRGIAFDNPWFDIPHKNWNDKDKQIGISKILYFIIY